VIDERETTMIKCKIFLPVTMKLTETCERIMDSLIDISGYKSLYDNRIDKNQWLEYEDIIDNKVHFVIESIFSEPEIDYLKKKFNIIMC